jgi:HSP20 family molecular chaperone IbpA
MQSVREFYGACGVELADPTGMLRWGLLQRVLLEELVDAEQAGLHGLFAWQPLVDVVVSPDAALVIFELAGVSEEDVQIRLHGNVLSVSGRRLLPPANEPRSRFGYQRAEIQCGFFQRLVELPWPADPRSLRANCRNGLLLVELTPAPVSARPEDRQHEGESSKGERDGKS